MGFAEKAYSPIDLICLVITTVLMQFPAYVPSLISVILFGHLNISSPVSLKALLPISTTLEGMSISSI
jgi:hypothetical protein